MMKNIFIVYLLSILYIIVSAQESDRLRIYCEGTMLTLETDRGGLFTNWYASVMEAPGNASLGCRSRDGSSDLVRFRRVAGTNIQQAVFQCGIETRGNFFNAVLQKRKDGSVRDPGDVQKSAVKRCGLSDTASTSFSLTSGDFTVLPFSDVSAELDVGLLASTATTVAILGERLTIELSRGLSGTVINVIDVYTFDLEGNPVYLIQDGCEDEFETLFDTGAGDETQSFSFMPFVFYDAITGIYDDEMDLYILAAVCWASRPGDCDFSGSCGGFITFSPTIPLRRRRQLQDGDIGLTNATQSLKIMVLSSEAERSRYLASQAEQQSLVSPQINKHTDKQTEQTMEEKLCANKTVAVLIILALLSTGLLSFFIATLILILRQKKGLHLEPTPSSKRSVYSVSNKSLK